MADTREDILTEMLWVMETHSDLEKLLEELGSSQAIKLPEISLGCKGLKLAIDERAASLSQAPPFFATWLLTKKLMETNDVNVIDGVIAVGVVLQDLMYINHQNLMESIIKDISSYSLYCLLKLHKVQLIQLEDLLFNSLTIRETVLEYFISSLISSSSSSSSHEVSGGILNILLTIAFGSDTPASPPVQFSRDIILETIQRGTLSTTGTVILDIIVTSCNGGGFSLDLFLDYLLSYVVSSPPLYNLREMLTRQNEATFSSMENGKAKLLCKITRLLGHSKCWENIIKLSQSANVNAYGLLQFSVCCVHSNNEEVKGYTKCIADLISLSLSQEIEDYLIASLLLARQAGLEGGHLFPSYGNWFKSVFGQSHSSLIESKKTLIFLTKCLTGIVTVDPPHCLQAHITFPPKRLSKCSHIITDYVDLAKSRLDNLQVDYSYVTNDTDTDGSHEFSLAEGELNEILSAFESSQCQTIPSKLLEYQMFNQPYYTGRLLRVLLAPRQIPSPPDTKQKLIEALKRKDKKRQSMFSKYERECKTMITFNNREGNISEVISSKKLLLYCPLKEKLERMCRHYKDNEDQLNPILSQVSTAISKVIKDVKKSPNQHIGDLCSPGLREWEIQIIYLLMEYITEVIINLSVPLTDGGIETSDQHFVLVTMFVKMLSSHPLLHWPLLVRLYELLYEKCSDLTNSHLYSLSVLCASLYQASVSYETLVLRWPPCCTIEPISVKDSGDYCLFLMISLVCVNSSSMIRTAKFYCHFFHHLFATGREVDLNNKEMIVILHKFNYISKRLSAAALTDFPPKLVEDASSALKMISSISEISLISQALKSLEVDAGIWLPWELSFDTSEDFLSHLARYSIPSSLLSFVAYRKRFRKTVLSAVAVIKQVELVLCCLVSLQTRDCPTHLIGPIRQAINNNNCETLQLVTELLGLVTPTSQRPLPLLLHSIGTALNKCNSNRTKVVQTCMSFILGLPPYLIFTDSLSTPPTHELLMSSAGFINNNILPFMDFSCKFELSLDITHHLITGLKQCHDKTPSSRTVPMDLFLKECPILLTSAMCHWSELCVLTDGDVNEWSVLKDVRPVCDWVKSGFDAKLSSSDIFTSSYLPAVAVYVYHHLIYHNITASSLGAFLDLHQSKINPKKFLAYILDCCTRRLLEVWPQVIESPSADNALIKICKSCLERDVSLWNIISNLDNNDVGFEYITNFRRQFPSKGEERMLPFIFLRILLPIDKTFIVKLAASLSLVKYIFSTHSNLLSSSVEQMSLTPAVPSFTSVNDELDQLQAFSPSFCRLCTTIVKTMISCASTGVLKNCQSLCHSSLKQSVKSKIELHHI